MPTQRLITARTLAKQWKLEVRHALYRKTGDWYHQLERFPGVLLDEHGFIIFATEEAYRSCPELRINQDVGVPGRISAIAGYTLATARGDGVTTSYEEVTYTEGLRRDVVQSQVERCPAARQRCIAAHGCSCAACGFRFEAVYGPIGEGFIHVHHFNRISLGVREVDPVTDMCPLCPNCHAMVHRVDPPISIEALRQLIRSKT